MRNEELKNTLTHSEKILDDLQEIHKNEEQHETHKISEKKDFDSK